MLADLHCHTTASDGALRPRDVLRRAAEQRVEMLAITDHDTVEAYSALDADSCAGVRIVTGIEFSTRWRGHTIHVVGLGIDLGCRALAAAVARQQSARVERAAVIARRLEKLGFTDMLAGARRIAGSAPVGRPHFAQYLVRTGQVRSISTAFRKYLGPGKPGDVRHHWPDLATGVDWIRAAGGTAVLAHPGKYRMTAAKLGALTDEFRACGGRALEVLCGQQPRDLTHRLARICNDHGLHASCGSDFHAPGQPWSELGRFGRLPDGCRPVWELL